MNKLFIVIFLVSCGAQKYVKDSYKTDSGQADISHDPSPAPDSANAPTEEYASYAATAKDVPDCKNANQNQLIYVNDVNQFEVCQSNSWNIIKIQGKDGSDGKDSPDPLNEKYMWKDPVMASLWLIPGASMPYVMNATCSGDYREPTVLEASVAAQRGLKLAAVALNAPLVIWTNQVDAPGTGEYTFDMTLVPMRMNDQLKTAYAGAYCVHK